MQNAIKDINYRKFTTREHTLMSGTAQLVLEQWNEHEVIKMVDPTEVINKIHNVEEGDACSKCGKKVKRRGYMAMCDKCSAEYFGRL